MKNVKKIFQEVYRQIANIPSFPQEKLVVMPEMEEQLNYVNAQIEKAIALAPPIIFILGPFGCGKTTQVNYFFSKNKNFHKKSRSFVRINTLDFAFLHTTNYASRFLFIISITALACYLFQTFPFLSPLPILLILAGFFTKTFGNLIYILHEAFDNFFTRKTRIVVFEDLERSSLNYSDQLAFLANLWQNKRIYLVTLGYDPEDRQKPLKLAEFALKLGGVTIEVPLNEHGNYKMIKRLDPFFPFQYHPEEREGWLSMFTFRELGMLRDQAVFRSNAYKTKREYSYVAVGFQFLLEKLQLNNCGLAYVQETGEFTGFSPEKFGPSQLHYLNSFFRSIDERLGISVPRELEMTK